MSNLKLFRRRFKGGKAPGASKMSPVKQNYLNDCHRTYSCIHCRAHLANHDELISKLFQGNHGRAYLFNKVVNTGCRKAVQRELLTGLHAVADIYCDNCKTTLGWKYEQAFAPSQKYKEGKYIIEVVHMLKENEWDLTSYNARQLLDETVLLAGELPASCNSFRVGSYHQTGVPAALGLNQSPTCRQTAAALQENCARQQEEAPEQGSGSSAGSASPLALGGHIAITMGAKLNPPLATIQYAAIHDEPAVLMNQVEVNTN